MSTIPSCCHPCSLLWLALIPHFLIISVGTCRIKSLGPIKVLDLWLDAGECIHVSFIQLPAPNSLVLLQTGEQDCREEAVTQQLDWQQSPETTRQVQI